MKWWNKAIGWLFPQAKPPAKPLPPETSTPIWVGNKPITPDTWGPVTPGMAVPGPHQRMKKPGKKKRPVRSITEDWEVTQDSENSG